jgi:hypothetical protein
MAALDTAFAIKKMPASSAGMMRQACNCDILLGN